MEGIDFIQDLAIVLLAAGAAGMLCKRLGLSVIVGYLAAGIFIGPFTPPFSFIIDVERIQTLSQIGLVFLMFAIGLGLSLTKLGRMGLPTLIATALGAFFMLNLTRLLGAAVGWSTVQSLFVAGMFMVSSSAVIAKIVGELNLGHERSAQLALAITVLEDVVAVVMLTVLGSQTAGAGAAADAATGGGGVQMGTLLTTLGAFVVLLVGVGLLLVPRMLRRLESKADPELQTIVVAGVLFMLALAAAKAGYSLALGAFLLGAMVAEMPQKSGVERSFAGMRDLFSSVFFVSIGMMIDVRLLADVWPWILGLGLFALVGRSIATGFALILVGTPPREARRAGFLLAPLGEFSFIIAQLGVSAAILPASFYPMAVGVSILTVLLTPVVNRLATPLVNAIERIEPRWVTRALEAYHGWLRQVQERPAPPLAWKLVRGRLLQIGLEMLFVSGLLIFSEQILGAMRSRAVAAGVESPMLGTVLWIGVGVLVLVPLVAIWRNVATIAMIAAESLGGGNKVPAPVVDHGVKAIAAVLLGYWLYAIRPFEALPGWGWVVIALAGVIVAAIFSNKLIYWHSSWQSSVRDVLAEESRAPAEVRAQARQALDQSLESWQIRLEEFIVPDAAAYASRTLADLALPTRFGCSVVEVERNGYVITATGPDLRLYPGDKLLLLGRPEQLAGARAFLRGEDKVRNGADEFSGSVLETVRIADALHEGPTLAELQIPQHTGVRVVGIQRGDRQIISPNGAEHLREGDGVLVLGTLTEIRRFRQWLKATEPVTATAPKT